WPPRASAARPARTGSGHWRSSPTWGYPRQLRYAPASAADRPRRGCAPLPGERPGRWCQQGWPLMVRSAGTAAEAARALQPIEAVNPLGMALFQLMFVAVARFPCSAMFADQTAPSDVGPGN